MKQSNAVRGYKVGFLVAALAMLGKVAKGFFGASNHHSDSVSSKYRNRYAFSAVSAPRCHTQRKHYKGFA